MDLCIQFSLHISTLVRQMRLHDRSTLLCSNFQGPQSCKPEGIATPLHLREFISEITGPAGLVTNAAMIYYPSCDCSRGKHSATCFNANYFHVSVLHTETHCLDQAGRGQVQQLAITYL